MTLTCYPRCKCSEADHCLLSLSCNWSSMLATEIQEARCSLLPLCCCRSLQLGQQHQAGHHRSIPGCQCTVPHDWEAVRSAVTVFPEAPRHSVHGPTAPGVVYAVQHQTVSL